MRGTNTTRRTRMKSFLALICIAFLVNSCMYTIHMVHTQGQAEDVIDDNDAPDIKTDATIPISL